MYRAMLVDDEYMILEGLKQLIPWEELGFTIVKTARSAKEALAYLETEKVNFILSDITMPEMSGLEMIEKIKGLDPTIAIMCLSGYQEFEYVREGMKLGIVDYLVKPVDRVELYEQVVQIRQLLDRKAQEKAVFRAQAVQRWVHDELNEAEFLTLIPEASLRKGPFTVLGIEAEDEVLGELIELLTTFEQMYYRKMDHRLICVWIGDISADERQQLSHYQTLAIGETVKDWENVYESYEKIMQKEQLARFYPDLLPTRSGFTSGSIDEEFSFLAFNKSLMIGDYQTIKKEVEHIFDEVTRKQLPPEDTKFIAFLMFNDLLRQFPAQIMEFYDEMIQHIRMSDTVYQLRELLEETLLALYHKKTKKPFSEVTQAIISLTKVRYKEELTLKLIADELHLNVVYIGQVFKKEMHLTFAQYLNQVRIKKAQELLLNSTQNINEISDAIGYNNTTYFSKMFKKLTGLAPKEFREQYASTYYEFVEE